MVRYYNPDDDSLGAGGKETGGFHSGEVISVQCAAGYHFEPPLEAVLAQLTCSANSLWVDVSLGGVRRCVVDRDDCPAPLVDSGYAECAEPAPEVLGIEVVTAQWTPRDLQYNVDAATVVDVLPMISNDYQRANQLIVHGRWLTTPSTITVGTRVCFNTMLRNITTYCWWPSIDSRSSVCRDYGESLICTLMEELGSELPVSILTGRGSRRRAISSLGPSTGPRTAEALTLSGMEPVIRYICDVPPQAGDPQQCQRGVDLPDRTLTECPNDRAFQVWLCASGAGLFGWSDTRAFQPTKTQSEPMVLADSRPLSCFGWRYDFIDNTPCDIEVWECTRVQVCGNCWMEPVLGRTVVVNIIYNVSERSSISNAKQSADHSAAVTVSFAGCPAGAFTNYTAHYSERCVPCPPGHSTDGLRERQFCSPCRPGTFAAVAGSPACTECAVGEHAASPGQQSCDACTGNAWQLYTGQPRCSRCDQNKYKVQGRDQREAANASTISAMPCEACPPGAECREDGSIVAGAGSFLLMDDATGLVSSKDCLSTACVSDPDRCVASSAQTALWSGVSLVNCCGENRRPAVDEGGNVNALCADCEDGFVEVRGQCVQCGAPRYDRLLALVMLMWLLVYVLHRLSHRWAVSAQLTIFFYSSQMALLFLASEPMPYVVGVVNIDLLGDPSSSSAGLLTGACVLPVNAYGKIGLRLLSPMIALSLLALLLSVQLLCRWLLARADARPSLQLAYRVLLSSGPLPTGQSPDDRRPSQLFPIPAAASAPPQPKSAARPRRGGHLELAAVSPSLEQTLLGLDEKEAADSDERVGEDDAARVSHSSSASSLDDVAESARAVPPGLLVVDDPVRSIVLDYESTAVRLAHFSYNALATVCLAFFHTREVAGFGRRLYSYPSVDTSSATYLALMPVIGFLLVTVVFGGPVMLFVYLIWLRKTGRVDTEAEAEDASTSEREGSYGLSAPAGAVSATSLPGSLMTAPFRPRYWFFSVFNMTRRLALILVLTFASAAPFVWLSLLNSAVLVLHAHAWPYRLERDNWVESVSLATLVLQTTLLAGFPTFQERPAEVSIALWGLLLLPGAVMALLGISDLYRAYSKHRRADSDNA